MTNPAYVPCTVRDLYSWEVWREFDTLEEAYRYMKNHPLRTDGDYAFNQDYGVFVNIDRMRRPAGYDFTAPKWAFKLSMTPRLQNPLNRLTKP